MSLARKCWQRHGKGEFCADCVGHDGYYSGRDKQIAELEALVKGHEAMEVIHIKCIKELRSEVLGLKEELKW